MGQLSVMTEAGDARGAGYIGGQLVKVLETIARISGELGDLARSATYNVTNNIAVLQEHPGLCPRPGGHVEGLRAVP